MATKAKVQAAFKRLMRVYNKKENKWTQVDGRNKAMIGAWELDHNPVYGGYVINEISNEGGGVSNPFGYDRRKPTAFVKWVNDIIRAREVR